MIPDFESNGNLPPGIHYCFWDEFKERFGYTDKRIQMISAMEAIIMCEYDDNFATGTSINLP
jgi:hypothetical protein